MDSRWITPLHTSVKPKAVHSMSSSWWNDNTSSTRSKLGPQKRQHIKAREKMQSWNFQCPQKRSASFLCPQIARNTQKQPRALYDWHANTHCSKITATAAWACSLNTLHSWSNIHLGFEEMASYWLRYEFLDCHLITNVMQSLVERKFNVKYAILSAISDFVLNNMLQLQNTVNILGSIHKFSVYAYNTNKIIWQNVQYNTDYTVLGKLSSNAVGTT